MARLVAGFVTIFVGTNRQGLRIAARGFRHTNAHATCGKRSEKHRPKRGFRQGITTSQIIGSWSASRFGMAVVLNASSRRIAATRIFVGGCSGETTKVSRVRVVYVPGRKGPNTTTNEVAVGSAIGETWTSVPAGLHWWRKHWPQLAPGSRGHVNSAGGLDECGGNTLRFWGR